MRLEKISLIIVLICAIVVLAVPFYRNIAFSQLRYTVPGHEKSIWENNVEPVLLLPQPKADALLLRENPKDFKLRLGLALKELSNYDYKDKTIIQRAEQKIDELRQDYPKQGVLYAVRMGMPTYSEVRIPQRIEVYGVTPEDVAKYGKKPKPATKEQLEGVHRCIELLNKAIAADPDNGWFHYQKALYLYGLHKDDEALNEIHLSAIAPRFTDYTDLCAKSIDHLFDLRGDFNPAERCSMKTITAFSSNFTPMRDVARITSHLVCKEVRLGNTDKGIRTALDITNAGYNMTKNAPTFLHVLVANAIMYIGAVSLDPTFKSKTNDYKVEKTLRIAHYKKYLINHRYPNEARILGTQWRQIDQLAEICRASIEDDFGVLMHYQTAFASAAVLIAILPLFAIAWIVSGLLTIRTIGSNFWDKRTTITSILFYSLAFVPFIIDLATRGYFGSSESLLRGSGRSPFLPIYLLIPLAIIITSLLSGFIIMLMRNQKTNENQRMPIISLLIAWLGALSGLIYLSCNLENFAESSRFFKSLQNNSYLFLVFGPAVAIILYSIIRAVQSRFDRVRKNAVLTFAATVRYSSAITVSIFCTAYICMVILTTHFAVKADVVAKKTIVNEAPIIRSVFK